MGKIIVECSRDEQKTRNTGANEQCLEGPVIRHAFATMEQEFPTVAALKTVAAWKADTALKKIIPSYAIEELAIADTEDTYFEGNSRYLTASGKKIRTFNLLIGLCSHNAIASYNGKKMRVYEFTDAQEIKAVTPDGIKVKGQTVTIQVGKRVDAMKDKPPYTPITLTYEDFHEFENSGVIVKPSWSHIEINGIFDVEIVQVSASATSVKFTVDAGCSGDQVTSLDDTDITFTTSDGTAITHSFVAADANGVYELTGTGFKAGDLLSLKGVVVQTEATYEAVEPLKIVI